MAKKKIHKLKIEDSPEFYIIAIASHNNDYRVSWAINTQLKTKLTKGEDLKVRLPKDDVDQLFSAYYYIDQDVDISYTLFSNKCESGYLLNSFKNVDFILRVSGEIDPSDINQLIASLKGSDLILTAFTLDELPVAKRKIFV